MSLKSKLVPIIASLGAAVTMAPALSSCSGGLNLETHNMLNESYYNHVIPRLPMTIYDDNKLNFVTDLYMEDAKVFPSILKDDLLYTYSKLVPIMVASNDFHYDLSKYYMYVQDFEFEKEGQWYVNFSFIIDIAGKIKEGDSDYFTYKGKQIEEFNLTYSVEFDKPFAFTATDSQKEKEKDKEFLIQMPKGYSVDGDCKAKSTAIGIIQAPNGEPEIINDVDYVNLSQITDISNDPTSLVLYREFINSMADPILGLRLQSHYFHYVTYEITE